MVVLGDLFALLMSKEGEEKITKAEWEFFLNWRANALKSSVVRGSVVSGLVYIATRKLRTINRFCLAGGGGFIAGYWTLKESYKICVHQILGLDGTRMQHELKNIVLQRYGNDPHRMRSFSKHFYSEEIYSDSNPGNPTIVYRKRRVFMDNPKATKENDYGASDDVQQRISERNPVKVNGPSGEIKQVRINPGISTYGYSDPLEVLFGYSLANEELAQPDGLGDAPKVRGRNQKRVRRRERMRLRHRESLSLGKDAQLLKV